MRKNIFVLVLITLSGIISGQKFQQAIINQIDGTQKMGLVKTKSLYAAKEIKYKTNGNAKPEYIPKNSIKSIDFYSSDDHIYNIENITIHNFKNNKITSEWMIKLVSGYYDLYVIADYSFDKQGNLKLVANDLAGRDLPEFYYFIKTKDEEYAEIFALYSPTPSYLALHKFLKDNVVKFMSDDKALVEKVENKNFSTNSIEKIVTEYNEFKKPNGTE